MNLKANNLKSFNLSILSGSYLFKQDERADAVYFITSGFVVLCNGEWETETIVSYVGPGEILGEKLFFGISDGKRMYSAKANTDVECIRLNHKEIEELKQNNKDQYIALLERAGKICMDRLNKVTGLVHCFKYENKTDRLMNLILYLTDTFGRETQHGHEVFLPPDLFKFYINLEQNEFQKCIQELVNLNIIKPLHQDHYVLTNRLLLMQKLPKIVEQIPSFPII